MQAATKVLVNPIITVWLLRFNAIMRKGDPSRPVDTVDPRDRSTDPAPPRTLPIAGTNPSATDAPPPSAMPNPYSNPRR